MALRLLLIGCLIGLLSSSGLWAQRCVSQERLAAYLQQHPEAEASRAELENFTQLQDAVQTRSSIDIPVVFHIVWNTEEDNISDEQILSQLEVLNRDFGRTNTSTGLIPSIFQSLAADMELNFCLARRTPNGAPSSGIVRQATPFNYMGDRIANGRKSVCYTADGGSDAWDTDNYVNVWVARREFFPAEASFPGMGAAAEDGVIISPRFIGTTGSAASNQPYHLGRTLTHELGHYFNLYHLWGVGQPGSCTQSDEVADTPLQSKTYLGECPTHPQITCGSADMFMNFMNYTDDACMAMFSNGQKNRVWAAIAAARPGLMQSAQACSPVSAVQAPQQEPLFELLQNPPAGENLLLRTTAPAGQRFHWQLVSMWGAPLRQGTLLSHAGLQSVDVSGLPAGMYVLRIGGEGLHWSGKVVME